MPNKLTADLHLVYLADAPELIPVLADWTFAAWSKYDPSLTKEGIINSLQGKLYKDKIPLAFAALYNSNPVGMANLKDKIKFAGYEDRKLWLGSFWVVPEFGGRGIEEFIIENACTKARQLGFNKISVFESDPKVAALHKQLGGKQFAMDTYQNHPVTMLEYIL
jgi:GNAT superfamily N-acetyltransferase